MKYKSKIKDHYLIINAKTSMGEKIDQSELDAFYKLYLRGFLSPKFINASTVQYTGPVGVSIQEYLKKPISKHNFFFIIEQIVVAIQKIQNNHLFINKLVMDIDKVYINEVTKEVHFIYVPLKKGSMDNNVFTFLQRLIYSVIPIQENDMDYVTRFVYFINSLKCFDADTIEKFIMKEDRSVVTTIKRQNAGQSGFMTDKPLHYYEHYDKKATDDPEATGLLGNSDDEATNLLYADGCDEATGLLDDYDEATGLLDTEATGLLVESHTVNNVSAPSVVEQHYATLYRVSTGDEIKISKPVFRLGKEQSYVDYFVNNNSAVSRSHADIITRGKQYFVIDLNSKNRTFINNVPLQVQCETEIHEGDTLKLGNEEFVFHV